jgi:hypothetical protein
VCCFRSGFSLNITGGVLDGFLSGNAKLFNGVSEDYHTSDGNTRFSVFWITVSVPGILSHFRWKSFVVKPSCVPSSECAISIRGPDGQMQHHVAIALSDSSLWLSSVVASLQLVSRISWFALVNSQVHSEPMTTANLSISETVSGVCSIEYQTWKLVREDSENQIRGTVIPVHPQFQLSGKYLRIKLQRPIHWRLEE